MQQSADVKELVAALHKAQGQIGVAVFDSENPHFKSQFASLNAVVAVLSGPFQAHGLSFTQCAEDLGERVVLTTTLFHISGQFIQSSMPLLLVKNDMQGLGSAITYAKRYALQALAGVVSDEDDDGNKAASFTMTKEKAPPQAASKKEIKNHAPQAKDFKIPDGKFKGQMFSVVDKKELKTYIDEILAAVSSSGRKPPKWFVELREAAGL